MDMIRIGSFLAELRKSHNLTQAELGAKLGVTNKTVSRWETGNYMPPVEMLAELSTFYGLTINEILSAKRLSQEEYLTMAESNIKETLKASAFNLKEKQEFWKKKWRKEHAFTIICAAAAWCVLIIALKIQGIEPALLGAVGGVLALFNYVVLNHRMMSYVEGHLFGGKWNESRHE